MKVWRIVVLVVVSVVFFGYTDNNISAAGPHTTSSIPVLLENLSQGERGPDVLVLQKFLISLDFLEKDGATGYFGPRTRAALIDFQDARGISSTGVAGPVTRGVINTVLMTRVSSTEFSSVKGSASSGHKESDTVPGLTPQQVSNTTAEPPHEHVSNASGFSDELVRYLTRSTQHTDSTTDLTAASGALFSEPSPSTPPVSDAPSRVRASTRRLTHTLTYGSRGPDVRALQVILREKGFFSEDKTPTEYFGKTTQKAVQDFQCNRFSLCSDRDGVGWGVVGPRTRAELNE